MDMDVYNMGGFFASFVNGIGWFMEVVPSNVEDNTLSIIKRVPLAFGWEVPVSSLTSASRSRSSLEKERQEAPSTGFNSDNKAKVWTCFDRIGCL
jgi:hypothetical protein